MSASINQQPNPLLRGSFPLLLVFLFAIFSAAMEVVPVIGKVRPQFILAVLGLLAVFGTGQFVKVLSTPIGRCVALFTAWFIACIPFGAWPGGSFGVFTEYWYKAALIFLLTAGLLTTLPQAIRLYRTIGFAVGLLAVVTLLKNNRSSDSRLVLDNTRYANSNDLAWTLLVGLIFIGFLYMRGSRWHKVIAVLIAPFVLLTLSRTGSRAGMLGAGLLAVVVLVQAKRATRNKLLAGLPVAFLAVVIVMPKDVLLRYTTYFGTYNVFDLSHAEKVRMATIESTESRKTLLIDSLIMTAKHPLLGVGPGNFMVVQNEMAQARGERSLWHVTHNTYTQVSSEMGVPGLIIYGAFLFSIFRVLNSIARNRYPSAAWRDLRQLALTLRAAFIVFLAVAFFDSLAYNADVPILAGITVALGFMAQKQRAIDRAASAPRVSEEPLLEPGLEPVAVGQY